MDNSSSDCSDAGSGRTPGAPWCDFANLDGQTFAPGTHILLKRGDTFHEELGKLYGIGTARSPIVLSAYGSGPRPHIEGSGAASDRGVWIQDASYWTVENLQISDVGAGLVFWYDSNGHRGLNVSNIYTDNVQGVFAGFPKQSDLPGMYHSVGILITGQVPVTTNQTAVSDVHLSNLEGYNNNDDLDISGFNANSQGQQGFLSTALGDHSVSDVTVTNVYFHHSLSGEDFDNLNHLRITGMRLEDTGYGANPVGTCALFFWSSSDAVVADSMLTGEQESGSPDETETDLEAFNKNISFLGDYYGDNPGGGIEDLEINGYTDNYQSGDVIADSTFDSTGTTATYDSTPNGPNDMSGSASDNLYGPEPGEAFSTVGVPAPGIGIIGGLSGWTYHDDFPVAAGQLYNAGEDFSSTQGTSGWSEQASAAGGAPAERCAGGSDPWARGWQDLASYDSAASAWEGNGAISATTITPGSDAGCSLARAWTAPSDGTISIRGRIVPELAHAWTGPGALAQITVNDRQVWPTDGRPLAVTDPGADGYAADLNLQVKAGDVVRFVLTGTGHGSGPIAWMPSIAYTGPAPTIVENGDSSVAYSSGWTYQPGLSGYLDGDADYSNTPGATATVSFSGTGITWYGERAPAHGQADVAICDANGENCGPATTVDTYAPVAMTQQALFSVSGLSYGPHTLKITVDSQTSSTDRYVDIDYFTETGYLDDSASDVSYSRGWSSQTGLAGYYNSDDHRTDLPGATAEVDFTGSGITWIGSSGDRGTASVTICQAGGTVCAAPEIVTPYDPVSDTQQALYTVGGLSDGPHVLKITLLRGGSIDVDAFAIDNSPLVNDDDPNVVYSPDWTYAQEPGYFDADAHYTDTPGGSATVTFTGTGITWIGGMNNGHGRADVSVCNAVGTDCGAPTMVDTYSANTLTQQDLFSVSGLPFGTHTLKITARSDSSGSGYYTDIDAFKVQG